MMVGALAPVGVFADELPKCTAGASFFGLDPWYAELECDSNGNIDKDQFGKDRIGGTIASIAATVVKDALFLIGIFSVILVIVGGIKYMLAQGEPGALAKAKKMISAALIGLVIASLSYAIVTFILKIVEVNV